MVVVFGLIALLLMWVIGISGELLIIVGGLVAIIGSPLYYKHKDWERNQFHKFYEEELLQLKLKKRRNIF